MKRVSLALGLIVAVASIVCGRTYTVIDSLDGAPIIGATVIGHSGIIKGVTDNDGRISINDNDVPITIRSLGYDPIVASPSNDTINMVSAAYDLKEVVVTPADRPIKRVLCFARDYSTGVTDTDTMQYYCEYMAEAFVVDGKVKGYRKSDAKPSAKSYRRYARIAKEGRDSIFQPKHGDDITVLSWFDFMAFLPDEKIEVSEALRNGAEADTVPGKYGPKFIFRKKNGVFSKTADVLSDHKNRVWSPFLFKLLGLTIDITAGNWTLSFADSGEKSFGIYEFLGGAYNIHIVGRGKWLKKVFNTKDPVHMDAYLEIYPVEITNLTVDEYKEIRDELAPIPFQYPDNLHPISPAVDSLVRRIGQCRPTAD